MTIDQLKSGLTDIKNGVIAPTAILEMSDDLIDKLEALKCFVQTGGHNYHVTMSHEKFIKYCALDECDSKAILVKDVVSV